MKHTKGPWTSTKLAQGRYVITNDQEEQHIVETVASYEDTALANAQLISAAPEMLEALEKALNEIESSEYTISRQFVASEIRKAIAKAKGETK